MRKYLLPESGSFYKANLHCHSVISDGHLTVEEIKEQYKAHGYSVVAFTDHDVLIPHNDLTDENFLALNGYEMEINGEGGKTCHLCYIALENGNFRQVCWHRSAYLFGNAPKYRDKVEFVNEPDYIRNYDHMCINDMIKKGREHGFFVTYNHPVWSLEDYPEYIGYDGMNAMEICNYGCFIEGYPEYDSKVYDDMLRAGKRIYCIGADDNHNHRPQDDPKYDSFGAFIMIKADKLEYRTVTGAMEKGFFYASQGPEIKSLWYEDGRIFIETSPAFRIDFSYGVRRAESYVAGDGKYVEKASALVPKDCIYVRVTVTDERGRHANTNAYFTDDLNL